LIKHFAVSHVLGEKEVPQPSSYVDLERMCIGNSICIVEAFKTLLDKGAEFSEADVKAVSSLLGEPTRKVEVFRDKYVHVYLKYVQENCVSIDSESRLCIYSWKPGVPVKYFPVAIDATGTILYYYRDEVRVLAYPTHRAHDIAGHGVMVPDPAVNPVVEVTRRVDGYQITFYYNPLLKKWIPATRYVLHNMAYIGKKLEVSSLEEIINPYATIANEIAEKHGLYDMLKGFEGWTFTFILEAPEPAIMKPKIELFNSSEFKLYLLNARKPDGTLLSTSESSKLLEWDTIPLEEVEINSREDLESLISRWKTDLYVRSRFVRFRLNEPYRPYTLEIPSALYSEAMAVKYASNPKSLIILSSYGYAEEALNLLVDYGEVRKAGREIVEYYSKLSQLIPQALSHEWFMELLEEYGLAKELRGEVEKARRTGDASRLTRKLASLLAGEYIYEAREKIREFYEKLQNRLKTTTQASSS